MLFDEEEVTAAREKFKPFLDRWANEIRKTRKIDEKLELHHYPRAIKMGFIKDRDEHIKNGWVICQDLGKRLRREFRGHGDINKAEMMLNYFHRWVKQRAARLPECPPDDEKWLWIVCGPNGAGKSTFVDSEYVTVAGKVRLVNPDLIALDIIANSPNI